MSATALLRFVAGGVEYVEQAVDEVEAALGATHIFTWTTLASGQTGFTVVRRFGSPKLCACPTMLCDHRNAIAEQLRAAHDRPAGP